MPSKNRPYRVLSDRNLTTSVGIEATTLDFLNEISIDIAYATRKRFSTVQLISAMIDFIQDDHVDEFTAWLDAQTAANVR
jgi:hypothetical protein